MGKIENNEGKSCGEEKKQEKRERKKESRGVKQRK